MRNKQTPINKCTGIKAQIPNPNSDTIYLGSVEVARINFICKPDHFQIIQTEFSACLAPTIKSLKNRDRARVQLPPPKFNNVILPRQNREGAQDVVPGTAP